MAPRTSSSGWPSSSAEAPRPAFAARRRYGSAIAHTVDDNPDLSRYELRVDGDLVGWADYRPAGDSVIVAHTEVVDGHEGEGLGSALVRGSLDAIRASGKTVMPMCPFTAAYIRRHPEYVDLVDASLRHQFG